MLSAHQNETETKTGLKQFRNCFVSVSFQCADSLMQCHFISGVTSSKEARAHIYLSGAPHPQFGSEFSMKLLMLFAHY